MNDAIGEYPLIDPETDTRTYLNDMWINLYTYIGRPTRNIFVAFIRTPFPWKNCLIVGGMSDCIKYGQERCHGLRDEFRSHIRYIIIGPFQYTNVETLNYICRSATLVHDTLEFFPNRHWGNDKQYDQERFNLVLRDAVGYGTEGMKKVFELRELVLMIGDYLEYNYCIKSIHIH